MSIVGPSGRAARLRQRREIDVGEAALDRGEAVDYLPGGYGVQYGRSMGGVVDIRTKRKFDETKLIWVETPTNPTLKVIDLLAVIEAVGPDVLVAVDNTFGTPVNQRPLECGAGAVVHSTTKYLGGHSDTVGGAVVVADAKLHEEVAAARAECARVGAALEAERAASAEPDTVVRRAAEIWTSVATRDEVVRLLAGAEVMAEVPFSMQADDDGRKTILRGTIDGVSAAHDGTVTVVEFKTGRPRPVHQAQLDIYLKAARELFPGRTVEGLLVYQGRG